MMRRIGPRVLVNVLLIGAVYAMQPGSVAAQIPEPTSTPTSTPDPTSEPPADTVEGAVDEVVEEILKMPEETTGTIAQPVDAVDAGVVETIVDALPKPNEERTKSIEPLPVEESKEKGGAKEGGKGKEEKGETTEKVEKGERSEKGDKGEKTESVDKPAEQTSDSARREAAPTQSADALSPLAVQVAEASPKVIEAIVEVVSEMDETITPMELLESDAAAREGELAISGAAGAGGLKGWVRSRTGLFSSLEGTFGSAQPSFAILVDAMNDADGDGIYTDSELAPAPGADVRFKALISNVGATGFEIVEVNHSYDSASGRVQVGVCEKLAGVTLSPGDSVPCVFSLAEYAPPRGQSLASTVTAAAFEMGDSRRGASDSDMVTVDTIFEGEALAVAIKRKPGLLAFTGIDAVWLFVFSLVLLGTGGALGYAGRLREYRHKEAVLDIDPWMELELRRWWSADAAGGPTETRRR
jgi:hypothetical protein